MLLIRPERNIFRNIISGLDLEVNRRSKSNLLKANEIIAAVVIENLIGWI
jgi:hypothetical protein